MCKPTMVNSDHYDYSKLLFPATIYAKIQVWPMTAPRVAPNEPRILL